MWVCGLDCSAIPAIMFAVENQRWSEPFGEVLMLDELNQEVIEEEARVRSTTCPQVWLLHREGVSKVALWKILKRIARKGCSWKCIQA
jgi:hypothetical protein